MAESQPTTTNATPDSTIGPASSTTSAPAGQYEPITVDEPGVYQGGSTFTDQCVQASDISQSSIAASSVSNQFNLNSISRQLTDHLQPLDGPPVSEDYQLSSNVTSKHQPEIELLPASLVVGILQQIKCKPYNILHMSACYLAGQSSSL